MKPVVQVLAVIVGLVFSAFVIATIGGLALLRHASPGWIVATSMGLVLFPPIAAACVARSHHFEIAGLGATIWSLAIFLSLPVYFPGERTEGIIAGLSLGHSDAEPLARAMAGAIPDDAADEPPVADTLVVQPIPAPTQPLRDHQIALPYEGDGRRLSVEIVIEHGGQTRELQFLLDTGATYTTMPSALLDELGLRPDPKDPRITLHTANGEREARIALLDKVWLGDLAMDGVAIATCDPCAGDDTVGLLGLNVTGGYNLTIDADRREVVFTRRADFSRHLDIKPFVDVGATITRHPGQVSVEARLTNNADRKILESRASIHCREETWLVEIEDVQPGEVGTATMRLPDHEPCDRYQVGLNRARW